MKRRPISALLLGLLLVSAGLVIVGPSIGLGEKSNFILLRATGLNRTQCLDATLVLSFILIVYMLLGIGIKASKSRWRLVTVVKSAWVDGTAASQELLDDNRSHRPRESWIVVGLAAAFLGAFAIFLWKTLPDFLRADQLWHQTFLDYDIDWGTPLISFGANVLYNFDIQLPLNAHLLPLERIAHAFPPEHRILATIALCFLAMGGLLYAVGGTIGLRPIPRTIFAGAVALVVTIPSGFHRLIWLLPPHIFTWLFTLALSWLEAPILFLTTVLLFFWLGQRQSSWRNIALGAAFTAGSFTFVLSYPADAIYFVFLAALYCLGFVLTCESRYEFAWKAAVSVALTGFMVLARAPRFFIGLYSYAFGGYFFELFRAPTTELLRNTFLVTVDPDVRVLLVFTISMTTSAVAAWKCKTAARRIAIATLLCEGGIIVVGLVNAFILHMEISIWYAELAHFPIWGSYFILFVMILAMVVDRRISELSRHADGKLARIIQSATVHRRAIYSAGLFIVMAAFAALQPRSPSPLPTLRPESIESAEREVAIVPGQPFRGRLLYLTLTEETWAKWLMHFSSDHSWGAAAIGIPTINEYGHWTSPVNFVFLRSFFARPNDWFVKAGFYLDVFDLRIARLTGVRTVLTEAKEIPGGTLIDETKVGDADLRIFRIDDINLGQYSPTRPRQVSTAAEALAALHAAEFDPKRDVVVEDAISPDLAPATFATVTLDLGPTLVVHAASPGRSLLVLPFEYSHCLRLDAPNGSARLIPVNLQQTGLLFEGSVEARITYRFGLFGDAACRSDDVRRADDLKLRDVLESSANQSN